MTLGELLAAVAGDLDDVSAAPTPDGGVTWSRGMDVFAALGADGSSAEFRLDPAIAEAARRTPDTGSSQRGMGWVRFQPAALDGHAVDRATAWFISAGRRTTTRR
ncbi:MAG: hypothetical protein ACXW4H_04730 [Candidatus Limnocylindrales bacterium]